MTTQETCVEAKKEMNSMHEEIDVSSRHMTWWSNAWWIRVDSGPHLRTAQGRRRTWRATRRAAEQARDSVCVGQPKRERGRNGEGRNGSEGELEEKKATPLEQPRQQQQLPQKKPQQRQQHPQQRPQQCVCSDSEAQGDRR